MYEKFTAERIAKLRTQKGVSARDMSLSLGQGESYVNKIENGHAHPSQQGLYYIFEYLGVTPKEFYDDEVEDPVKLHRIVENLKKLDDATLDHVGMVVQDLVDQT